MLMGHGAIHVGLDTTALASVSSLKQASGCGCQKFQHVLTVVQLQLWCLVSASAVLLSLVVAGQDDTLTKQTAAVC
jgi:hypothetical protein